jgi:hypothetical protein
MQSGVSRMPRMHGGAAAMNHVIHGLAMVTPAWLARSRHRRFCAAAVRKRLLEKLDTCSHTGAVTCGQEATQALRGGGHKESLNELDTCGHTGAVPCGQEAQQVLRGCGPEEVDPGVDRLRPRARALRVNVEG